MIRKHRVFSRAALVSLLAAPLSAQPLVEVDGAPAPALGRPLPRVAPLSLEQMTSFDEIDWVETAALDVPALLAEDAEFQSGRRRVGIVQDAFANSAFNGQWLDAPDGGKLWVAKFRAAGAVAMRLRIEPWTPPEGARLTIFSPSDPQTTARGPYTRGNPNTPNRFWTPTIYAGELYVEYYLPPDADWQQPAAQIEVTGLVNQYFSPFAAAADLELGCHLDAMCDAAWADPALGVGALAAIDALRPDAFFCSGALLNRIPTDGCPLFMTATHCDVTDANADTVEVTWLWQRNGCGGALPNPNTLPTTPGCTVLVRDDITDWTLVGLTLAVPGGLFLEGWSNSNISDGAAMVGIHHPDGAWKRISYGTKTGNDGFRPNPAGGSSCISGSAHEIEYDTDGGAGLTEPGSSGSPIFDSAGRVRGVLSCGSSTCSGNSFSSYGRLDMAYFLLEPYLIPTDPVYANSAYPGFERGTIAEPFNTVKEAYYAVIAGHTIRFQPGMYNEQITLDRPMTLRLANPGVARIGG